MTLHVANSLGFHWSLDLATLEDNLLLQSTKTPHRCPQRFTHKHKNEVQDMQKINNQQIQVYALFNENKFGLTELPHLGIFL